MGEADAIKIDYQKDGTVSWEAYIEIKRILFEYSFRVTLDTFKSNKEERTKMVNSDTYNMEEYRSLVCEKVAGQMITESQCFQNLMARIKVPDTVFEKSQQ